MITRDQEGHLILIKGSINQKYMPVIDMYESNNVGKLGTGQKVCQEDSLKGQRSLGGLANGGSACLDFSKQV